MAVLAKFIKQPGEKLDYDIDYSLWFEGRTDSPATVDVVTTAGITFESSEIVGNVVKVTLSGGADGAVHKITTRLTTTDGLIKEADIQLTIKES